MILEQWRFVVKLRIRVGIVGATGLVGKTLVQILENRNWCDEIMLFASEKSKGKTMLFRGNRLPVRPLTEENVLFSCQIVFFAATGELSKKLVPLLTSQKIVVIDKSATWRLDPNVPLVIPEINADALYKHRGIIASPNCTTTGVVMALAPIHELNPLKSVKVVTLQAASGAGEKGMEELELQRKNSLNCPVVFPDFLEDNVIPQCEMFFGSNDEITTEEIKLAQETRKILSAPDIDITALCVRVPVSVGHSAAMCFTATEDIHVDKIWLSLVNFPGLCYTTNPLATPFMARGKDKVYVSRLRSVPARNVIYSNYSKTFWLWSVIDNIRKGAATNAVQIAKYLIDKKLLFR